MKTLLVVAALAALCALPLPVRARAALGSSKDAAKDAAKDPAEQCACQSDSNRPQQLIRGADQVSRCQKGDYCDCEAKTVANCDMSFMGETGRLNEDEQMCDFTFDCQAFFDRPTESPRTREPTLPTLPTEAAETTAAAPTPPPEPCTCENATDASRPQQLIRGADQVSRCQKGDYCDCGAKAVVHCDMSFMGETGRFNEDEQMCDLTFDCQAFFRGPTARPPTAATRTPAPTARPTAQPTAAPTPPPQACTCAVADGPPLQLVRGDLGGVTELALCQRGDYCHCESKTLRNCGFSFLDQTAKLNEDQQMCDFLSDCEASLHATVGTTSRTSSKTTAGTSSRTTAGTSSRTTAGTSSRTTAGTSSRTTERTASTPSGWVPYPASGSSRMTLSATLFSLTAVLTVFNLLLLYRRACWPNRAAPFVRLRPGVPSAVPTVCYPGPALANHTPKLQLESAA